MRHVITLSTIPPRFADVGHTLATLVAQRSRPEAVELYIPRHYRRFPQWGGGLPEVPEGVRIVRVEEDFGPATKVLPAARAWRGQGVDLLFVDDDQFYLPDWAAGFLKLRRQRPDAVLCAAAKSVRDMGCNWDTPAPLPRGKAAVRSQQQFGYNLRLLLALLLRGGKPPRMAAAYRKLDRTGHMDIFEGYSGVALRPEFLDEAAYNIPEVLWSVDDVWLSGHLARRGIPIWADQRLDRVRAHMRVVKTEPLYGATIDGANRATANLACINYFRDTYGIWGGSASQSA